MDKDGRNLNWIFQRMHVDKPIDIAFLGSSRTLNAINDSLLSTSLTSKSDHDIVTANLAISWMGRNLQYILLQDLLETRKPKVIVLEVRERESPLGHIGFPLIAKGEQIVFPASYINFKLFRDFFLAAKARLEFTKDRIIGKKYLGKEYNLNRRFGFESSVDRISISELEQRKTEYERSHNLLTKNILKKIAFRLNKSYLYEMIKLAEENEIPVLFVYVPHYKTAKDLPLEYNYYAKYGQVLIPPSEIYTNPGNFANLTHLNRKGSALFTEWLSVKLENIK